MTPKEQRLWQALSDLHTLCLCGAVFPDPLAVDPVMRAAQAALAIAGPDTEDDLMRTLHWPWADSGKAWAATKEWLSFRRKIKKPVRTHISLAKALTIFAPLRCSRLTSLSATPQTFAAVAVWMSRLSRKASIMDASLARAAMTRSSICE